MEDRNIGKKLWLEEFFGSFCGVGGVAADVGLTVVVAAVCCSVGEVGDVCCLEATGTGLLESVLAAVDDDDGEVAAVFSVAGVDPPVPPPVGSVRPLDLVETPPLAAGESFRLSVSLIKSSTLLLMLLLFSCSLELLLLALSGTSIGCCFSEFGSILLFVVIALC